MKNISKKVFGLVLAGAVFFTGCSAKTEKTDKVENNKNKLKVVTTIFPEYDITRAIAKDKIDLELLIKQVQMFLFMVEQTMIHGLKL